jgi:hypothetical protein
MSRSLLAHARPPSPSLTLTPRRPEPPLHGRVPAGCRSGQKRTRASRRWQTSKNTIHAISRVHTAAPANADAGHPLHLPLSSPSSPCTAPGVFSPQPPSCLRFFSPRPHHHHPTHPPEAPQGEPASLLGGEGALRPPSTREEGRHGNRFRPSFAAILPLPSPSFQSRTHALFFPHPGAPARARQELAGASTGRERRTHPRHHLQHTSPCHRRQALPHITAVESHRRQLPRRGLGEHAPFLRRGRAAAPPELGHRRPDRFCAVRFRSDGRVPVRPGASAGRPPMGRPSSPRSGLGRKIGLFEFFFQKCIFILNALQTLKCPRNCSKHAIGLIQISMSS